MDRLMNNFDLSKRTIYGSIGPRPIQTDHFAVFCSEEVLFISFSFKNSLFRRSNPLTSVVYRRWHMHGRLSVSAEAWADNVSVWKVKKCWRSRQNMTLWIWFWLGPWKKSVVLTQYRFKTKEKFIILSSVLTCPEVLFKARSGFHKKLKTKSRIKIRVIHGLSC